MFLLQEDGQSDTTSCTKNIIAIWNIREPSFPQKILIAPQEITASCFDSTTAHLVFAGLSDGSICVWDLREKTHCHRRVETKTEDWTLRSPTYNTGNFLNYLFL